jgi:hypothetical protein
MSKELALRFLATSIDIAYGLLSAVELCSGSSTQPWSSIATTEHRVGTDVGAEVGGALGDEDGNLVGAPHF